MTLTQISQELLSQWEVAEKNINKLKETEKSTTSWNLLFCLAHRVKDTQYELDKHL